LSGFWARGKERYGLALVLILIAMIYIMAAPDEGGWRNVALLLEGLALFAALRAAQPGMRLGLIFGGIIMTTMLMTIVLNFAEDGSGAIYVRWASLILVSIATPAIALGIVLQVKEKRAITIHTMLGVLCIFLLIGLVFGSAFALIEAAGGQPFFREGQGAETLSNYLYFSLTTITTAGLGDFSAAAPLGRSLTAAEALIGQIYLVTVVAVIVANLSRRN
jgi:hypothetical protein